MLKVFRKRLRLSVGTSMLLILVAGLWLADRTNRARRQKEVVAQVLAAGGTVYFDAPYAGGKCRRVQPSGPAWLRRWLDPEFFREITAVNLPGADGPAAKEGPRLLASLQGFPVHTLYVHASHFQEDDLAAFRGLTRLRFLRLRGCYDLDAGAHHLSDLRSLEELDLDLTRAGDPTLKVVSGLPNLTVLRIGDATDVTDAGVKALAGHSGLKGLVLPMSRMTDSGLADIAGIEQLDFLDVSGARVTDSGLRLLSRLSKLDSLQLSGCGGITDRGMSDLAACGNLTWISLNATRVGEDGLKHLSKLPKLRVVRLPNTVDLDARADLRKLMPNVKTTY